MANITLVLREPNSDKETPVILILRDGRQRAKIPTQERIEPNYWDKGNYRAKKSKHFPSYPEFNQRLKNLENQVSDIQRRLINDGDYVSPNQVKKVFLDKLNGDSPKKRLTFWQYVEKFLKESSTKRTKDSLKTYKTTIRTLKEFEKHKGKKITFENISLDWYDSYIEYLTNVCDYVPNTIGRRITDLKAILNDATEKGYNKNLDFKSRYFKKPSEKVQTIYLTKEELLTLYEKDLSFDARLEKARDLFLVGCWTGLRFSDFSQIKPENIKDNVIAIKTQKTGEMVVIPLHWMVRDILKKYEGKTTNSLPPSISMVKLNAYIKEVGQLAQINSPVLISKTKGGKRIQTTYKKHELITSHTARRSFATNAYLNDVPSISIMKITGHKTEKSFLTYIKVTPEENAQKLLQHPFFAERSPLKLVK